MPEPEIRPSALLLIVGAIQAVFLMCVTLYFRSRLVPHQKRYAAFLLALLCGVFAYLLLDQFLDSTAYFVFLPILLFVSIPLDMLIGPSLFGLVAAETNPDKFRFKPNHLLHLVPALFVFLSFIPVFILPPDVKIDLFYNTGTLDVSNQSTLIRLFARGLVVVFAIPVLELSLLAYLAASVRLIWLSWPHIGNPDLTMTGIKKSWMVGLLALFSLQVLLFVVGGPIQTQFQIAETTYYNLLLSSISLLIFLSTFVAFSLLSPQREGAPVLTSTKKYQNSGLDAAQAAGIGQKIIALMEQDHLYRDPELKLPLLAEKLGYSSNITSQVINTQFEKSFSDFVNHYRIEEAKKRLSDPNANALILTIANEVGFNTKATFNATFKKIVGTTPSQYRKDQQQEKSLS